MARLRYVKTLDQVKAARQTNPEFLESTVRSLRAVYETDPKDTADNDHVTSVYMPAK